MTIEKLAQEIWSYKEALDVKKYKIKDPSIPIMYFGDYEAYQQSPLKIITVGLNPSHEEFPINNIFSRFRGAENLDSKEKLSPEDTSKYLNSLNTYFKNNSYKWFDSFEPILNPMNASFYHGKQNTALHTDFCSPLATIKAWSKYEKTTNPNVVRSLQRKGSEYWHKLVNLLQPHIILVSIREEYKRQIFRTQKPKWTKIITIDKTAKGLDRKKPYEIQCTVTKHPDKSACVIAFGANNVVPFMISTEQKQAFGNILFQLMTKEGDELSQTLDSLIDQYT
jgi:hypothetical protein